MRQIIKDWCDYCENKNNFDKSHFYTLFWNDSESHKLTSTDIEIIFSYFEEKDKFIGILNDYLFNNLNIREVSNDDLIFLAQEDVNEKIKLLEKSDLILSEVVFDKNFKKVKESRNKDEFLDFYDEVSDVILDNWKIEDKKSYALYEALYGLTKDYEIVWHLFSPLLNIKVNLYNYFALTINGGVYSIYHNRIIVSRE